MQFAIELGFAPFPELFRRAKKAESSKFDLLCYYDHTLSWNQSAVDTFELWTTLAALTVKTSKIRLAPLVTDELRRHPSVIAQAALTIDELSQGRMILIIGAGSAINLNPFGIEWNRRLQKLKEAIEVIKLLWSASPTSPANFKGEFYSLANAFLQIKVKDKPRIYQSAFGRKSRILAGELADGLVLANESPEMVRESISDFDIGATKSGKKLDELDIVVHVPTAVSDDVDKARSAVLNVIRQDVVSQPFQRKRLGIENSERFRILDEYRRTGMNGVSHDELLQATKDAADLIPESLADRIAIYGTPDNCISKIEEYLQAGAKTISLANCGPNALEVEEFYGSRILPYFHQK